jgi:hypothetical protein
MRNKTAYLSSILVFFVFVSFSFVWFAFQYLPISISSTTEIAEINGDRIDAITIEKVMEDTLLHSHDHHRKSIPTPQFGIKYKTQPNRFVRALQPSFRATTAMSAKFRYDSH